MPTDFPLASSETPRRDNSVPALVTRSHLTGRNSISRQRQIRKFAKVHLLDVRVRQRILIPLPASGLCCKAPIPDAAQRTGAAPAAQHSEERSQHADRIQRPEASQQSRFKRSS